MLIKKINRVIKVRTECDYFETWQRNISGLLHLLHLTAQGNRELHGQS